MKCCWNFSCTYTMILKNQVVWTKLVVWTTETEQKQDRTRNRTGEVSFRLYKFCVLGEVSFGMLKLGELGEVSFRIYKLCELVR